MSGTALLGSIDWNGVLLYGIPAYIAALGSAIAAVMASRNGRKLNTTNGRTIGEHVEATHEAVTESVAALNELNGTEKPPEAPAAPSL